MSAMQIASDSWRLGLRAATLLPRLFVSTGVVLLGYRFACLWSRGVVAPGQTTLGTTMLGLADQVVETAVIASMLIGVHRLVLLQEVADRPVWRIPPGYDRFVAWLLLLSVLWLPSQLVLALFGLRAPVAAQLLAGVSLIALAVVALRITVLFPAIAIDEGADWRVAWRRTKGRMWAILGTTLLTCVPLILILVAITLVLGAVPSSIQFPVAGTVAEVVVTVLWYSVAAVIASRLYLAYATGPEPV